MKKAIVRVGYTSYVIDTQKALTLLELLADAELYEEDWKPKEKGGTTFHIYPQQTHESIRDFKVLPTALYHMAKMAGKPERGN